MPYGGGPKSGCDPRVRPMKLMYASDCGSIGAEEMSWFHQLSAGKSERPLKSSPSCTAAPAGAPGATGAGSEGLEGLPPHPASNRHRYKTLRTLRLLLQGSDQLVG